VGSFEDFLLKLPVPDQLIQALGNIQTRSASGEESESDKSDHGTHEFFGTDSARMLKHGDDHEGRDQSQNNAEDSRNYKNGFTDHEGPQKGGMDRVSNSS
jgi:hypothetical protein